MSATPEGTPENPHVISFSNEQLGARMELTLAHPAMETLEPNDRALLERLVRAESYTLAMFMMVKEDMPANEWRNGLIHAIDDQHESVFHP